MNTNNNPSGDNNQPKMPKFNMNWIYTIIIAMLALLFFTDGGRASSTAVLLVRKLRTPSFRCMSTRATHAVWL